MQLRFNSTPTSNKAPGALGACLALAATLALPAAARADLCVDQQGVAGCVTTISAAVAAATPGTFIRVHRGVYHEDVVITIPLTLIGEDRNSTIIDAGGLSNGIYINGFDNPALGYGSLDQISVSGFTVRNANFEGILANNVSHLSIFGNAVLHNDQALRGGSCPGLPEFETAGATDCGQGIHLIGAVHSSITSNDVEGNAGGILVSDETTPTHDDVITQNEVESNLSAGGITVASHPAYFAPDEPQQTGSKTYAFGVYDVLVLNNEVSENGGGGIAILALGSGNRTFANFVVGNRITGNAGAGFLLHTGLATDTGAKNPDASRNTIVGNFISGNGPDSALGSTLGAGISIVGQTPVIDSLVNNNVIDREGLAIGFNSASTLDMHLNSFSNHQIGVANLNPAGTVQALENWWGCPEGPRSGTCASFSGPSIFFYPWLTGSNDDGHSFSGLFSGLFNDGSNGQGHGRGNN